MFKLTHSETIPLTPQLARTFMEMEPSPTEREFSERRANMLRDAANNGLLLPFHWSQAELNGKLYRMNGQHSSAVLSELEIDKLPADGRVHLDTYKVDDEEDLVLLFRQIDNKYSARNSLDISGAFQKLHPGLKEVPIESGWLIVRAVSWYRKNISGADDEIIPTGDDVGGLFNELTLHPFIHFASAMLGGTPGRANNKELRRVGVVAGMYATYQQDAETAKAFWERAVQSGAPGIIADPSDPAHVLEAWLLESKDSDNRRKFVGVGQANFYQACVYCWNAMRTGKPISTVRHETKRGFAEAA